MKKISNEGLMKSSAGIVAALVLLTALPVFFVTASW